MKKIVISGKRKTAIAKATIGEGNGKITINKKKISSLPKLQQLELNEPIILAKEILGDLKFDISVWVKGGGTSSQIEASRLAIAKAITKYTENENLKMTYLSYDRNLLVADTRRKETRKPGDSKARAMRQTSYR
ncbi:MAG: 30S ribosomal protein S9 [Candidatus Pacearchaeota archaeon]